MVERLIHAAISTGIIILLVPVVGLLIEFITEEITKTLAKGVGIDTALFIMNILTFVGTIHHELSHALYALITGAKVTKIQVFKPEGNRLGYVSFIPRGNWFTKSIQLTMSGIAPTVQGFVSNYFLVMLFLAIPGPLWLKIILGYIIFSIFIHSTMSGADLKAAAKGLPFVAILIFIICFAFDVNLFGRFRDAYMSLAGLNAPAEAGQVTNVE
ncbi:MAG: M50 family metallopeptidase [Lachnospiraceae bacterium]|nr:M50 family metallopeptidase [Lachnospiraceae bacterium]